MVAVETIEQVGARIERERREAAERRAEEIAAAILPYAERIEADKREREAAEREKAARVEREREEAMRAEALEAYTRAGGLPDDFEGEWREWLRRYTVQVRMERQRSAGAQVMRSLW